MKYRLLLLASLLTLTSLAQEEKQKFGIKVSGWVSAQAAFDTRKIAAARQGEIPLYPMPVSQNSKGEDVNAQANFGLYGFFSRVRGKITAPDFLNAKVSGLIEVDFAGTALHDYSNLVRMRHAFAKLSWEKAELLAGQYWHPMFVPQCYPHTIAWAAGLPVATLSRSQQIKFSYKPSANFQISLTAASPRIFSSTGPYGKSYEYLQNSGLPEFHVQLITGEKSPFLFGLTAGYKTLVPRYKKNPDETISSYNFNAFARIKAGDFSMRLVGIYGQNLYDLVMLGGYAVAADGTTITSTEDDSKNQYSYTNISTLSIWTDLEYKLGNFGVGAFAGISKNQGAEDNVLLNAENQPNLNEVYARGSKIGYTYHISPRAYYREGNLKVAAEVTYYGTGYGTPDKKLVVQDIEEVNAFRFLLATFLYF